MPMSRYRHGADFERATKAHLEAEGYWVIRAASSKGKADLLAFKIGQVLIVQCKKDGKISPAERAEVIRIAGLVPGAGGVPIVAYKTPGVAAPQFDRLTGPGPKDRERFLTDEVAA